MNRLTQRLLPLLAMLPAGCFGSATFLETVAVFPSDLRSPVASVIAWPADAEGARFRFVFQDSSGRIDGFVPPQEIDVVTDELLGARLPQDVGAVTVLVPETANSELRARARALVTRVEEDHPGISTSVVVTPVELAHVEDAATMSRALDEARARLRCEFPSSFADKFWALTLRPRWVVLPTDAEAEQFVAIGNLSLALEHDDPALAEETLFDEQGLLDHIATHPEEPVVGILPIALLVPPGCDASKCEELAARLLAQRGESRTVQIGPVEDSYSPGATRETIVRELQRNEFLAGLFTGRVTVRFAYEPIR